MADLTNIDPTLYGGARIDFNLPSGADAVPAAPIADARAPAHLALQGTPMDIQARAVQAQLSAPEPSALDTVRSAAENFSVVSAWNALTGKEYEDDPTFNFGEALLQVPMQLSEPEQEFMRSTSAQEFENKLVVVKRQREIARDFGAHPVVAALTSILDPGYLLLGGVGAGLRAAGAGRAVASAAAAASAGGLGAVEATQRPMELKEIVLGAMLEGAAVSMISKGGKLVKKVDDFPEQELQQHIKDFVGPPKPKFGPDPEIPPDVIKQADGTYVRVVHAATPPTYEDVVVPAKAAVTREVVDTPTLPKNLAGAKPRYSFGTKQFTLVFESDVDKAAYIAAQVGKSAKDAEYLEFAKAATGWSSGQVVAHGNRLKAEMKAVAAGGKPGEITIKATPTLPVRKRLEIVEPAVPQRIDSRQTSPGSPAVTEPWTPPVRRNTEAAAQVVPAPVLAEPAEEVRKGLGNWLADRLYWNAHNTMAQWDSEVADTIFDNNRNLAKTSVESEHRAIRADLASAQYEMEDIVSKAAKARGASLWQRVINTAKAAAVQQKLEREIFEEMLAREQFSRQGREYVSRAAADVQAAADALEAVAKKSLDEMTAAGVRGLEDITPRQGWISRKWNLAAIEAMESKIVAAGLDAKKAHQQVVRLVASGLRRANGWDDVLAYDVAATVIDRAKRKGYFEDVVFETNQSNKVMHQVRDELKHLNIPKDRLDRVMKVLEGHNDEVGKPGFLKRRLDLDYKSALVVNGETLRLTDLLDSNILSITDKYLDGVASKTAWARAGYKGQSDIDKLREQLLHKTPASERRAAAELFDNALAALDGRPAGQQMNDTLRKVQQFTRMLSLRNSGIYQLSEYATAMGRFGVLKTVKYAAKNMPGFRSLLSGADKTGGKQLQDILARISSQDIRIRPFVHRFEDNFAINAGDNGHLRLQQAGQLVPYINAMKYIHSHQAQMVAGLVVDRIQMAASGNAKAQAALAKYGINAHVWERLKADITRHGNNVDAWSDGTWNAVRPALAKMMDESVMRSRMGDLPAFAQFDNVGKFIFTYRSFVLGAHNKLLAGTLDREGIHGMSLLMLYQYPLAALSTQMAKVAGGNEPLDDNKLASATVANMGSVGLMSELWGVVSGEKREFGSPGTIAVDRVYKLVGASAGAADPTSKTGAGDVAEAAIGLIPLLAIPAPVLNIAEQLKTKE